MKMTIENLDKNLKLLIMNLSKDNKNIFLKAFFKIFSIMILIILS